MASETVAYELKITGNLESGAKSAAREVDNLGDKAKRTEREVHDMGESFDSAGKIGEKVGSLLGGVWGDLADVTIDLGEKVGKLAASLGPGLGGAVGLAGAAAIATGAVVLLGNAALAARDDLQELGYVLDTPGLDAYAAATNNLSVALDRLTVAAGEAVGGPLADLVNVVADGVEEFNKLATAIFAAKSEWGALLSLTGIPLVQGIYNYATAGPAELPQWQAPGQADYRQPSVAPTPRTPSVRLPPPPIAGPSSSDLAWEAYQRGLAAGSGGSAYLAPSSMEQFRAETDALTARRGIGPPGAGVQALAAAGSGGGLGSVLGAFGPWGAVAGALATPDLAKNLTGAFDQGVELIDALPDILVQVLGEFIPHVIQSLDEIIMGAVEALIIGIPKGIAALLGFGAETRNVRQSRHVDARNLTAQHRLSRDTQTALLQLGTYGFGTGPTGSY